MDDVIQRAKERLRAIEAESIELRSFLRTYEKLAAEISPMGAGVARGIMQVAKPVSSATTRFYGGGDGEFVSSKDEIIQAARRILRGAYPEPVAIGELYEKITKSGLVIGGKNPKGNLSAKLAPPDDIFYVKDEGWFCRPQKNEPPDRELGGNTSEGSISETTAKDREAGSGGGP